MAVPEVSQIIDEDAAMLSRTSSRDSSPTTVIRNLGHNRPEIIQKCSNCHAADCTLWRCSNCKASHYCSRPCQRSHWKAGHSKVCFAQSNKIGNAHNHRVDAHVNKKGMKTGARANAEPAALELQRTVMSMSLAEARSNLHNVQKEMTNIRRYQDNVREKAKAEANECEKRSSAKYSQVYGTMVAASIELPRALDLSTCVNTLPANVFPAFESSRKATKSSWNFTVEDFRNISRYIITIFPENQRINNIPLNIPDVNNLLLRLIPHEICGRQKTGVLIEERSVDAIQDRQTLLNIVLPGTISVTSPIVNTDGSCILLRVSYYIDNEDALDFHKEAFTSVITKGNINALKCISCNFPLIHGHETSEIEDAKTNCDQRPIQTILPMPAGYWDDISDYLSCYEGVRSNCVLFSTLSLPALLFSPKAVFVC